jgi:hypothetical protein
MAVARRQILAGGNNNDTSLRRDCAKGGLALPTSDVIIQVSLTTIAPARAVRSKIKDAGLVCDQ